MCMYMCLCAVYGMKALTAHTFVDDVFGGTLVSTVKCTECANVSSTAEHSPLEKPAKVYQALALVHHRDKGLPCRKNSTFRQ